MSSAKNSKLYKIVRQTALQMLASMGRLFYTIEVKKCIILKGNKVNRE